VAPLVATAQTVQVNIAFSKNTLNTAAKYNIRKLSGMQRHYIYTNTTATVGKHQEEWQPVLPLCYEEKPQILL